ncbi:PREDICTED: uncharacterized protein LOC108547895 [Eufriesea mexicana]|uniref:uncharacterized protein LOC108547895 n=1 Tax=Eufriesea mexicana TaxID=516756 RepID=UPI00083BD863|nr:PREDICTED: uncharacterized protein LOC108547895 [Eufriesea mexicana]
MHYPLHITLLVASLWILRDDASAAKNGLSAEVLTSFARNIASVLSTTLLTDYQEPQSNQSSNQSASNLLKRIQETQSPLDLDRAQESSKIPSNASLCRHPRHTRELSSSSDGKEAFQNAYITNTPRHSKYHDSETHKPFEFSAKLDSRTPRDQMKADSPTNVNARENSIDADIKATTLHYSNQYHQPLGFRYKPEPDHQLPNTNHYAQIGLQPHYHRLTPQTPGLPEQPSVANEINPNAVENENPQVARITRRPYNLNYHGPFHASYYQPFHRHAGFYPQGRPIEGEGQSVAPASGQDESNPSRLINDQNQGQTALGGYDYGPRFHYRPYYHGGYYHGFPGFYPGPLNDSFGPGYADHGAGNGTGGPYSFGPPYFYGPRFGPYDPYHQPFYPSYYGNGRPAEPQNPPENQATPEQIAASENGQGNVNGTTNYPPFGYPYGPYYGGFNHHPYPLTPFGGLPYRFGYGFHDHPFPRIKTVPYLNFYPSSYHHFPFAHWYPFGGYYPYNNHRPAMMPEKPAQAEKTANENPEAAEPPPSSEAEMLSEIKAEMIRSSASNQYKKRASEFVTKESKLARDQVSNQLA